MSLLCEATAETNKTQAVPRPLTVWRAWVEWCGLLLWHLLHLAVQLTGAGLVEAAGLLQAAGADGVEHAQGADAVNVSSVLGHLKGHLDMALGSQVVHLIGLDSGDNVAQVARVRQVSIVQEQAW